MRASVLLLVAIEPVWRTGCVLTAAPSLLSHHDMFCFSASAFRVPLRERVLY